MSRIFPALTTLALLAISALAQEKPGAVVRVFVIHPKPGATQQFEEGRKNHMQWHRKQNDSWRWETWQVTTGEAIGTYLSITPGHNWKDFDTWDAKFAEADTADAAASMGPYIAAESSGIWVYRADVSKPPEGKEPLKMAEVIHFMVKPDAEEEFDHTIRKIHEAIGKTNWQPGHSYSWYELVNGGEEPHMVLVLPHNSWAEMAPPEVSFEAMLEKAFGRQEAEWLLRSIGKSVRHEWSEILTYRPDLSYVPPSK